MTSKGFLITILIAAAVAPSLAIDYMVEWKLDVNYTQWASGKEFHVGDTLMFMYTPGVENLYRVTGADFKACNTSNALAGPYTAGNETFTLDSPGKRWFISGIDCSKGVKLAFAVAADGPAAAPAPPPSVAGKVKSFVWMVAALPAVCWMIMA